MILCTRATQYASNDYVIVTNNYSYDTGVQYNEVNLFVLFFFFLLKSEIKYDYNSVNYFGRAQGCVICCTEKVT